MAPGCAVMTASQSGFATEKPSFLKTRWLSVFQLYTFCVSELALE